MSAGMQLVVILEPAITDVGAVVQVGNEDVRDANDIASFFLQ